jgi:septum formation protein
MKIEQKMVLGSKSPRRIELLQQICQHIEVRIQDVEEIYPENLMGEEVPVYLSDLKASALASKFRRQMNCF